MNETPKRVCPVCRQFVAVNEHGVGHLYEQDANGQVIGIRDVCRTEPYGKCNWCEAAS